MARRMFVAGRKIQSLALACVAVAMTALMASLPSVATAVTHGHARTQHTTPPTGLNIPQIQVWTRNTIRYSCDHGRQITVHYSNAKNEQSFALLPVKDRNLLFVNVSAASGAKYVAGQYSWWTKGPEGDLRDEMADPKSDPLLANCKARP